MPVRGMVTDNIRLIAEDSARKLWVVRESPPQKG